MGRRKSKTAARKLKRAKNPGIIARSMASGGGILPVSPATAGDQAANLGAKVSAGARKFPWGKAAKMAGPGIMGLLLASSARSGYQDKKKARALEMLPDITPQDILMARRQEEMLAGREARLQRNDPEAYELLQNAIGAGGPLLAPGEFAVGSPTGNPISSMGMEQLLASLRGD